MTTRKTKALTIFFLTLSCSVFSQDLSERFKVDQKKKNEAAERLSKLKSESILVSCNYDKGWGNLYRVKNNIYKVGYDVNEYPSLNKVSSIGKNGKYKWREKHGSIPNEFFVDWELNSDGNKSYSIYMMSSNLPVMRYSCLE
jgi:hypothetical protein